MRPDNTNLIKVFDGTVKVSGKRPHVTAGQQIDADANGTLSKSASDPARPTDPYPLAAQCAGPSRPGTNAGTVQTSTGDTLATGQTETSNTTRRAEAHHRALLPRELHELTVIDPSGVPHASRQGARPCSATSRAAGISGIVRAINVSAAEPYAVSFASNAPAPHSDDADPRCGRR